MGTVDGLTPEYKAAYTRLLRFQNLSSDERNVLRSGPSNAGGFLVPEFMQRRMLQAVLNPGRFKRRKRVAVGRLNRVRPLDLMSVRRS